MPIVAAVAGVAAAVGKGVAASHASKKAASQQAAAAADASKKQEQQYGLTREDLLKNQEQTRADYSPFLNTGTSANNQLGYSMGFGGTGTGEAGYLSKPFTMADYQADPGYDFRVKEGMKALDRVNAAKGKYFSGQAIKGLTDYNQESASQEYQNAYDRYRSNQSDFYSRLTGIADRGMNAAGGIANSGAQTQAQLNNAGQNKVNQVNDNIIGAGNARAAGTIGQGQAWVTGLNGVGNAISQYAASASDIRLKENIEKIGNEKGFNIYKFNYKGKRGKWRGVMAQEVREIRPDAVTEVNGFLYVFYDLIGIKMEAVCQ